MFIYTLKRKNFDCVYSHGEVCLFHFSYTCIYMYTQITLNLVDFAGDKNIALDFSDASLFRYPGYFDY